MINPISNTKFVHVDLVSLWPFLMCLQWIYFYFCDATLHYLIKNVIPAIWLYKCITVLLYLLSWIKPALFSFALLLHVAVIFFFKVEEEKRGVLTRIRFMRWMDTIETFDIENWQICLLLVFTFFLIYFRINPWLLTTEAWYKNHIYYIFLVTIVWVLPFFHTK